MLIQASVDPVDNPRGLEEALPPVPSLLDTSTPSRGCQGTGHLSGEAQVSRFQGDVAVATAPVTLPRLLLCFPGSPGKAGQPSQEPTGR